MEDIHVAIDEFGGVSDQGLFAVFDGHGGQGIVKFLEEHFAKTLDKNLKPLNKPKSE